MRDKKNRAGRNRVKNKSRATRHDQSAATKKKAREIRLREERETRGRGKLLSLYPRVAITHACVHEAHHAPLINNRAQDFRRLEYRHHP